MLKFVFIFLILCNISLWFIVFTYPDNNLHIIACDVGQGDGILIMKKTTQIIIDGGPGSKMTNCLDRHLPFWDRTIEMVMNTHPQLDHYEGLIDVFKRYHVQIFTANSLKAVAPEYGVLRNEVLSKGVKVLTPAAGMKFIAGSTTIDILHPSAQFVSENSTSQDASLAAGSNPETDTVLGAYTSPLDPNEFSIQAVLHYGNFDAMFTGDADWAVEQIEAEENLLTDIEYLKVPHHGSKNGLNQDLLDRTTPEIAVISDGKKNTYGHPHKQTLDMLEKARVQILRTDQMGDVEVVSDGERYWVKK